MGSSCSGGLKGWTGRGGLGKRAGRVERLGLRVILERQGAILGRLGAVFRRRGVRLPNQFECFGVNITEHN